MAASVWIIPTGPLINIAVSWPGLDKLGAFDGIGGVEAAAKAFDFDSKDPPDAISLRAYGPSAPENWWNRRFQSGDITTAVQSTAIFRSVSSLLPAEIRSSAQRNTLEELIPTKDAGHHRAGTSAGAPRSTDGTFRLPGRVSQPLVNWDDDPALGQGAPNNRQGAYPRGTFIIDDWDKKRRSPFHASSRGETWSTMVPISHSSGSYQDVAAFNRFLRDNAPKLTPALARNGGRGISCGKD